MSSISRPSHVLLGGNSKNFHSDSLSAASTQASTHDPDPDQREWVRVAWTFGWLLGSSVAENANKQHFRFQLQLKQSRKDDLGQHFRGASMGVKVDVGWLPEVRGHGGGGGGGVESSGQ